MEIKATSSCDEMETGTSIALDQSHYQNTHSKIEMYLGGGGSA